MFKMFKTVNISSKTFIYLKTTQRLRTLFAAHNISNSSHANIQFNEKGYRNKCSKSLISGNQCLLKPLLWLSMGLSTQPFDTSTFERIADHTLDHLYEQLDALIETISELKDSDVSLSNGVITWNMGLHGVYVINKQTPNKQIWFSSPLSGPKRYDYINEEWLYKRDGISLFNTLSYELTKILKREIQIKPLNQ